MVSTGALNKKSKLHSLGFLRSLTVLMVCFRHYGKPLAYSNIFPGLFRAFNTDGGFSVQVFFVMSGFIVPYSFNKGKYALGDFFLFLKKRFWRLYPPYLAALALTLVISFFSYKIRHLPNPETLLSITKSLFWLHFPADNPVFWTLKIEAQYYVGIGLFYIALIRRPSIALFLGIPIILSISLTSLTAYISLLNYIGFFLFGTIGFLIYSQKGNMIQNWIALCMVFLFSGFVYKLPAFVAATGAFVLYYLTASLYPRGYSFLGKYPIQFIFSILCWALK